MIFGQAHDSLISTMQKRNKNNSPVGFLGAMLGAIARANVQESVARVKEFILFHEHFQDVEFGFGDINLTDNDEFVSLNLYESLSRRFWMIWMNRDISSLSNTPVRKMGVTYLRIVPVLTEITGRLPETGRLINQDEPSEVPCCLM